MTLDQAKEQVALDAGFTSFRNAHRQCGTTGMENLMNKAAELYARSKWDECYQKTAELVTLKPEFKP